MIFFRKLIPALLKLLVIFLVITFEKVVGLPMIFITFVLVFFANEQSFFKFIILIFGSFCMALVFEISFSLSLLLLVCLVIFGIFGKNIISNDINRVLLTINTSAIIVALASKVFWGGGVIAYFIFSTVVMIVILMKTLFSKHGLTDEIIGKKSNFFR